MSKLLLVGIDLGTTNTSCSVGELLPNGSVGSITPINIWQLLHDPDSEAAFGFDSILPSVIYFREDGEIYSGLYCKIAAPDLTVKGGTIIRDIKRQMGNSAWHINLGKAQLYPRHISSLLLLTVKRSIEHLYPDGEIHRLVLAIPASFSSLMRQETLRAALLAGFDPSVIDLLDEPVAALLSALIHPKSEALSLMSDVPLLVFDMGGGTLDTSIVTVSEPSKKIDILATSRYHDFAGNDMDLELAALVLQKLRLHPEYNRFLENDKGTRASALEIGHGLLAVGERIKLNLSGVLDPLAQVGGIEARLDHFRRTREGLSVNLTLDFSVEPEPKSLMIPVHELISTLQPFMITRGQHGPHIFAPVEQALARAGVRRPSNIYLAGGSSYFPLVQDAIGGYFTTFPTMLDPFYAVSQGAVAWAEMSLSGAWKTTETMRDGIYLKRRGHSFLEIFTHPAPIPSPIQETEFTTEECPYFTEGGNRVRLEFFQGDSTRDPLLGLCHVEDIQFEQTLDEGSRLSKIRASIDTNKMFHFDLFFQNQTTDIIQSVSFQPGRLSPVNGQEDSAVLKGLSLNGESI